MCSVREEERSCEYPAWFRNHRKYISLDAGREFHLNHLGTSMSLRQEFPSFSECKERGDYGRENVERL